MNTTVTQCIGLDVAKSWLDLDLPAPSDRSANTAAAIAPLLKDLPHGAHLVCEATGGYEAALVAAAQAAGVPISVVPPQRVRHHARSAGQLAKTNRIDRAPAQRLRPQAHARGLRRPGTRAPAAEGADARAPSCSSSRNGRPAGKSTQRAQPLLCAQAEARQALLAAQLAAVERAIRELVQAAAGRGEIERLQQVQGVGPVTAWTVWAELPELGRMAPGQAGASAGLAPHARDSGQRHGPRHIQQGNAQVRRVLYMAAVAASQHNPVLRPFSQRLRARGKPAKLALVAVARRLIELLNLLLKNPHFVLAS